MSETATTDTFTVKLDTEPTANVTITVTSGATDEASVNPGTLTFTSGNWNSTQTVTVTGVDDDIDDGTQTYNITLTPSSTDTNYGNGSAVTTSPYPATTADDSDAMRGLPSNTAAVRRSVTEATGSGRTDTFTVKLDQRADRQRHHDGGQQRHRRGHRRVLRHANLQRPPTGTPPSTITVTGVDDDIDDGTQTYNIVLNPGSPGVGGDSNYGSDTAGTGQRQPYRPGTTDDDTAGVTFAHSGTQRLG